MGLDPLREAGKLLVVFGAVLILVGTLLAVAVPERSGLPARLAPPVAGLGQLPEEIIIRRENFTLYFPLVMSRLLSLPAAGRCDTLARLLDFGTEVAWPSKDNWGSRPSARCGRSAN